MKRIPVVLLSNDGVSADAYHLAMFRIAGFFGRIPSGYELVSVIKNALQPIDQAVVGDSAQGEAAYN